MATPIPWGASWTTAPCPTSDRPRHGVRRKRRGASHRRIDEASRRLVGGTRGPVPAAPRRPARQDDEHVRHGTANLSMIGRSAAGTRHAEVTQRRTGKDFAGARRLVSDEPCKDAEKIVLAMDDLNTHELSSPCQASEPAEARRLRERFEAHHTPGHGSWLNMAEAEPSVLARQCLDQRFADRESLSKAADAWQAERNKTGVGVDWQFTTADARIKLKHLSPSISA
ncbi:MAG: transposase [Gemmataceae bacterium]|nr:transposase [Gemmataceae bacterium]